MVDAISIALSGLRSSATRVGVAANNIAGASATGAVDPSAPGARPAYTPQDVVATSNGLGGVDTRVVARDPATIKAYSPGDPNADENGMVAAPNVDLASEIVDTVVARNAYGASAALIRTARDMDDALLSILDERA
jgi:flagellar basal-body rod protein FlgC